MPAVYPEDLIAKRDKKDKMIRSVIKRWNVHFQTEEEVEEQAREKRMKADEAKAKEVYERLEREAAQDEELKQQEIEAAKQNNDLAYNATTGSYSGAYGQTPVESEEAKSQIDAILHEKSDVFGSAMSALGNQ